MTEDVRNKYSRSLLQYVFELCAGKTYKSAYSQPVKEPEEVKEPSEPLTDASTMNAEAPRASRRLILCFDGIQITEMCSSDFRDMV